MAGPMRVQRSQRLQDDRTRLGAPLLRVRVRSLDGVDGAQSLEAFLERGDGIHEERFGHRQLPPEQEDLGTGEALILGVAFCTITRHATLAGRQGLTQPLTLLFGSHPGVGMVVVWHVRLPNTAGAHGARSYA